MSCLTSSFARQVRQRKSGRGELLFRSDRYVVSSSEAILRMHAQGMRTHCTDQRALDGTASEAVLGVLQWHRVERFGRAFGVPGAARGPVPWAPGQADLMKGTAGFVAGRVKESSIFDVLHRECHVLFPDELFADLFADSGRRSVPPRIVAVVMVLQRLFGLSDRDAVEAFEFDARWKFAAGGLDFDSPGFAHTVLVDMRARLAAEAPPKRSAVGYIIEVVLGDFTFTAACWPSKVMVTVKMWPAGIGTLFP